MDTDRIKTILENGAAQAEELLKNPSKVDELLEQFENKLKVVPAIGDTLADIPLMIAMVKGYITGQYKTVSPKVIALLVGSFLYLLKKKDLIADNKPFVGYVDDVAVMTLALKLSEPELNAFSAWRNAQKPDAVIDVE